MPAQSNTPRTREERTIAAATIALRDAIAAAPAGSLGAVARYEVRVFASDSHDEFQEDLLELTYALALGVPSYIGARWYDDKEYVEDEAWPKTPIIEGIGGVYRDDYAPGHYCTFSYIGDVYRGAS